MTARRNVGEVLGGGWTIVPSNGGALIKRWVGVGGGGRGQLWADV